MPGEQPDVDRIRSGYAQVRPLHEQFSAKVRDLIAELVVVERVLSTTGRAKELDSYAAKALRRNDEELAIYADPLKEITDLSGVRVICYTLDQASKVCEIVRKNFEIVEYIDKAAELLKQRKLGYTSFHFLVKLSPERCDLPEYHKFRDLQAEIQVRTILQHAWAEIEHRVQYKKANSDDRLYQKFLALAGLLQIADREFGGVVELSNELDKAIESEFSEIDSDALGDAPPPARKARTALTPEQKRAQDRLHKIGHMFGKPVRELVLEKQFEKAEAVYSAFIVAQPTQASHYAARARVRALMGKTKEAKTDVERALEISPNWPSLRAVLDQFPSD